MDTASEQQRYNIGYRRPPRLRRGNKRKGNMLVLYGNEIYYHVIILHKLFHSDIYLTREDYNRIGITDRMVSYYLKRKFTLNEWRELGYLKNMAKYLKKKDFLYMFHIVYVWFRNLTHCYTNIHAVKRKFYVNPYLCHMAHDDDKIRAILDENFEFPEK